MSEASLLPSGDTRAAAPMPGAEPGAGGEPRNLGAALDFFNRTSRQLSNSFLFLEGKGG